MLTDSAGQALRQGRAEMTCLCCVMYETSAEELKGWGQNHLKQCCLIELSVMMKICYICTLRYGCHQAHMATERLKYG